jgi:hypothetical protein
MNTKLRTKWFLAFAPFAAAMPFVLWQCGGGDSAVGPSNDASTGADQGSGSSGGGNGSSGGSGAGSSGTNGSSGGTASSSGAAGSSGGSGSSGAGSSSGARDGGGSSSGVQDAGPPPMLCDDAGAPAGCVQCLTDTNCPTATPRCLTSAGTCVVCLTNTDCGNGTTPSCWPSTHTCHARCDSDGGACPAGVNMPNVCDTTSGACVGCRSGQDCPTARPVCDTVTKQCEQCQTDTNCSGTTPRCDTAANPPICVTCLTNPDCANSTVGPVCRQVGIANHTCVAGCVSNAQCTNATLPMSDAGAPACNLTTNTCVQCVDNTTCSAPTPLCDTAAVPAGRANRCQECLPANLTNDAGIQGCDGGMGSNMCLAVGLGGGGQFSCR